MEDDAVDAIPELTKAALRLVIGVEIRRDEAFAKSMLSPCLSLRHTASHPRHRNSANMINEMLRRILFAPFQDDGILEVVNIPRASIEAQQQH